ncbi:MAG: pentapeptide repeat-containing protein [SAR324 cluster bacterium]|nr:pentapeptide repeat-containing protein [SAR324 cluster bacterium]
MGKYDQIEFTQKLWPGVIFAIFFTLLVGIMALTAYYGSDWSEKGSIGDFFGGFLNSAALGILALGYYTQTRELAAQRRDISLQIETLDRQVEELELTREEIKGQTDAQREQLRQSKLQEVLANVRLLADSIGQPDSHKTAISEIARTNLILLKKYSLEALYNLTKSRDTYLINFGTETIDRIKDKLQNAELSNSNFEDMELTGATFDLADLRNSSFAKSKFNDTRFCAAKLVGSDFSGAKFIRCDFSNVVSEKMQFLGAEFSSVSFFQANLSGTNLVSTKFISVDFKEANLTNANLCNAKFCNIRNLDKAILQGADFERVEIDRLWEQTISEANVRNFDMIEWSDSVDTNA